jgi:uncharacterized membrane protein
MRAIQKIGWCYFSFFIILSLMPALTGAIYFIAGFNILRLKNWARLLSIYYSVFLSIISISIIYIMSISLSMRGTGIISSEMESMRKVIGSLLLIIAFILLAVSLVFLIYFTRPKVKRAFSERNPRSESGGDKGSF